MTQYRIAIVGGGITGLTAARRLAKQAQERHSDIHLTVFERSNRLGGKVLTYRDGGLTLEAGPDSMLARKPAGVGLLRELGLESEMVNTNPRATHTYIVKHGRLEPMPLGTFIGIPMDVSSFLQTNLLSSAGKVRALLDLLLPKSNLARDVSLGQFLRSRLGDEWVDHLAEPLLAGIYAGKIDTLSLRSTWPQFVEMAAKYRSLIIGARAARGPKPSTNAGMPASGRSAFVTVRGGLQSVIERLADTLADSAQILLSQDVTSIDKAAGGYTLTVEANGETRQHKADAVIVCTPVAAMKSLLDKHLPARSQSFNVPYISTATVIVGYPADHIEVDLSTASGFLVPRGENRAITASTWLSSKWPHTAREDFVVLRCYVGRAGQQAHLNLDDEELVRVVHQEVKDLVGISPSPVFHKVTRWPNAMPNYPVGHHQQWEQLQRDLQTSLPGVTVAGGGYEGLGLPDCIAHGEAAADETLRYLETCSR